MAVRIHVTAIRSSEPEAVRKAFIEALGERFRPIQLAENRGWVSFQTSVWTVGASDLSKGIAALDQPALQFTTEDASCWRVTLWQSGSAPRHLVHTFGLNEEDADESDYDEVGEDEVDPALAFLEDEPEPVGAKLTVFERFAEERRECGCVLPSDLIREGNALPFNMAVGRYLQWQADTLIAFLRRANVEFDEAAFRRTLRWEGLSDGERDSDIGNLPRLLSLMGLGRDWDQYVQRAESYRTDVEEEEPPPPQEPAQWIETAQDLTSEMLLTPLPGGPVALPVEKLHCIGFIPECCRVENDIRALLTVEFPPGSPAPPEKPGKIPPYGQMRSEYRLAENGFQIGFEDHLLVERRHIAGDLGPKIGALVKSPPDGTRITLAFGAQAEGPTVQSYAGIVRGKDWVIDSASPSVSAEAMREALTLAQTAEKTRHTLRDEAEARAVMEAVRKDGYLHGMEVRRTGLEVSCQYDVDFLAKILARIRLRQAWDFGPFEARQEKDHKERLKREHDLRRAAVAMARKRRAKRIGKPFFRGRSGPFWRSEMPAFEDHQADLKTQFETGMKKLGFSLLGELTAKRFPDHVLLCYVSSDRLSYADLTASGFGYLCHEFISEFSDGSRLTTTTLPMVWSRPEAQLYYKDFPGMEIEALHEKHRALFERFRTRKHATAMPLDPTIEGLARRFDDTIVRTEEDERNSEEAEEPWDEGCDSAEDDELEDEEDFRRNPVD